MPSQTENRKVEHINISLQRNVQARKISTGFEDVCFVHQALPEINRDEICLSTDFLGHKFSAPVLVGAMTGGTPEAEKINSSIAEAVERLGLGMGVGSQRAALEDPRLRLTYKIVREKAPNAFLVANLGAPQLAKGYGVKETLEAIEMVRADALAIHLNPLQEAIQPEGEANYEGCLQKIGSLIEALQIPLIVKETGAGISAEVAQKLERVGVEYVDVSGAGGTSWAAVEYYRAESSNDVLRKQLGKSFWDWGVPTVASIVEVVQSTKLKLIASGGIRTGTQMAKALALGADMTSISTPILRPAMKGAKEVEKTLSLLIEELKNSMFLIGAESVDKLKNAALVILGNTATWLERRGFKPEVYARR